MTDEQSNKPGIGATLNRRTVCKMGLATGLAVPVTALGQPPNRARPQAGDTLVFEDGPHTGETVRPELLTLDQKPVAALARDPETNVLRDGSRLNRVMITRIDPARLTEEFRINAAEGVIAYSAVCTHTGCDVINWDDERQRMACPCHESQFDIYDGAKVVGGPAPRPLAMLPLYVEEGIVKVAGAFIGRVGFTQQF